MAHRSIVLGIVTVLALVGTSCGEEGTTEPGTRYQTAAITDDFSHIPDPRTRWANYGLRDYLIDVRVLCFCDELERITLVIVDGEVFDVLDDSGRTIASGLDLTDFRPVDEMFDWVDGLFEDDLYVLRVEYDSRFGFPSLVFTDPEEATVNDEREETRSSLRRLVSID